jgi:transposase-like protein
MCMKVTKMSRRGAMQQYVSKTCGQQSNVQVGTQQKHAQTKHTHQTHTQASKSKRKKHTNKTQAHANTHTLVRGAWRWNK